MEYNQIEAFIYCWLSPFVVSHYSSYKITILSPLLNCCCVKVLLCLALFENNTLMFVWPARWCLIEINFYSFLLFRCKKVARKIHNISLIIQDRPNKAENIQAKLKVWMLRNPYPIDNYFLFQHNWKWGFIWGQPMIDICVGVEYHII